VLRFYEGSGSKEIDLLDVSFPPENWERLKRFAIRLLEERGTQQAADLLRTVPFQLRHGTNGFGDEFQVLYYEAPMQKYLEMADKVDDQSFRWNIARIVAVLGEMSHHVRFVAVGLNQNEGPEPVSPPSLAISSDVVERALRDAERLIAAEGAPSGVDRVHTAFHGYLIAVLQKANIAHDPEASITELFRLVRNQHLAFQQARARQADIDKILRSLANIVDTLNSVRNKASVAHPNATLLEEPEAMLVINSIRSLLHYLNSRA
jgi:hypothetical protein